MNGFTDRANFIWSIADLLRGDYKQSEYGKVILPLTVIRRMDSVLEPTKDAVLAEAAKYEGLPNLELLLRHAAKESFYNFSPLSFIKLLDDPENIATNLISYLAGFSPGAAEVVQKFKFDDQITKLRDAKLLYRVIAKFCEIDLHPSAVSNHEMGYIYEELIRRFSELSNETAGEHFTPREVIRLMVNLLFATDDDVLRTPGTVRTLYDPACGTGGMLSTAEDYLRELNPNATLVVFGQELNDETFAICRSDMMMKGEDADRIHAGNSFSEDGMDGETFDYMLSNPPFGVEWKKVEEEVRSEAETLGFRGRFGAGLPRINDGSFLFLQHMISKMKPASDGGSRIAIVFNGSPLFTGGAGSGESEIRRWIIENDWLEAVVALPDQLFYNTGISTYFWIVTNRKAEERMGFVQLIDARERFSKMRKSLGQKRKEITTQQIEEITRLYGDFTEGEMVKILSNEFFGFQRVTVERPLHQRYEMTAEALETICQSKPWKKLTEIEAEDYLLKIKSLVGTKADTRAEMKGTFGFLPAALEKVALDACAIRHEDAHLVTDRKGNPEPDPELRDNENISLPPRRVRWEADTTERLNSPDYRAVVDDYIKREVLPWVPDAWVDYTKSKVGYEIPLTRQFYKYVPPRPVAVIDAEIKALEAEIQALISEVAE